MEHFTPVSRDRVSPLEVSPRRLYFDTDSPPEDLFQNRFVPRRLYSKTKSSGGETISSPLEINSPPGESLFRRELGYSRIAFIANQSTLFWLTHLYPNYALFSSRNKQNIKRLEFFANNTVNCRKSKFTKV